MSSPADDSLIAVIGMAGRFPEARDVEELWRNLRDGKESIRFLSDEELLERGRDPAALGDPDHVAAIAEMADAESFDAPFFGINPREAELLDPQHRVLLECAWHALEDAGHAVESEGAAIGLFAGATTSTYLLFNLMPGGGGWDPLELLVANAGDTLTTRVSYKLNLRGPSFTVQCACSTSLVAVHLACESLLSEECDIALAGGVSINYGLRAGYRYREESVYSPDGHCRTFDAGARGTVFGSGVGVVALRRLADALADGDPIRAVIRGSAVNNDGALRAGYTAPGLEGQAQVIAEALAVAGVGAESISYVEAHGTATQLGDPIEVEALTRAFRKHTDKKGFCAIGSVKSNVGHLDVAAGVCGLIKTVLALEHRQIPPTVSFTQPNPKIDFASSPVYVARELREWPAGQAPRRAGVSAFGMGGTNAHVILEEAPRRAPSGPSRQWQLLSLSARTPAALARATEGLAAHLAGAPEASLADVAYTLHVGRRAFEHRRVLVCRGREDAARALAGAEPGRLHTSAAPALVRPVAFLLPGLGEHYPGMGWGLYEREPAYREAIDRCAALAEPHLGRDLRELIGTPDASPEDGKLDLKGLLGRSGRPGAMGELDRTLHVHPAIFAVEYALARLLMSWGVLPRAMIGHSLGEYVAACLAGVIPLEDALRLVVERARRIDELPGGAMLAVTLPEDEARALLGDGVWLSAVNGPEVSVVAGESAAVAALEERLTEGGVACRRLPSAHAFHTPMMEPAAEALAGGWRRCQLRAPEIPFVSNVTGRLIRDDEATDPDYWTSHLCRTVRFADGLTALAASSEPLLLEVGPGQGLGALALQHPAAAAAGDGKLRRVVLASLRSRHERVDDAAFLLTTLGRLWLAGAEVDWHGFYAGQERRRMSLPGYPFERHRYVIERGAGVAIPAAAEARATVHSRPDITTEYVAPRSELERRLAEIWQELLRVEEVGVRDSFLDLGGHSLLATQLLSRLREDFGVRISLEQLFADGTVAGLATTVETLQWAARSAQPVGVAEGDRDEGEI